MLKSFGIIRSWHPFVFLSALLCMASGPCQSGSSGGVCISLGSKGGCSTATAAATTTSSTSSSSSSGGGGTPLAWTTVDDHANSSGNLASAFVADASGNLFVAGETLNGGNDQWIVRRSVDGGATWADVDYYQLSAGKGAYPWAAGRDSAGNLYVVGMGNDSGGVAHWITRKSADGTSWSTVDDFRFDSPARSNAYGFVADSSGNVFVAGTGADHVTGQSHWLVRKSANAGATWTTVDDYDRSVSPLRSSLPLGMTVDSSGNLFATGYGIDSTNKYHWITRKGTVGGGSWTTVDDYQKDSSGIANSGQGLLAGASGVIYASGYAADTTGVPTWIVRKSTDSGGSWAIVDDYLYPSGSESYGVGLAKDGSGNVFVCGLVVDVDGANRWIMRKTSDAGSSWTTDDDFLYATVGAYTEPRAMGADNSGHLFVVGYGVDDSSANHWLTRKY